jgi:hypothetical protein
MRTVGYGGMSVSGRLPDELAATATPHRYYTATKILVASEEAVKALDKALQAAFRRVSLWLLLDPAGEDPANCASSAREDTLPANENMPRRDGAGAVARRVHRSTEDAGEAVLVRRAKEPE